MRRSLVIESKGRKFLPICADRGLSEAPSGISIWAINFDHVRKTVAYLPYPDKIGHTPDGQRIG
jgi:hypothetical protein